jgi:hypothetical protein
MSSLGVLKMNDNFWIGFEKRAGIASKLKDVFRVGSEKVNIAGPSKHIGSDYVEKMRDAMPKIKDVVKKKPVSSMADLASRHADPRLTPGTTWRNALSLKPGKA